MGPLISMFEEAADWLAEGSDEGSLPAGCVRTPDSWEWLTVAIFTCPHDCAAGCTLSEAAVAIANE
jgi:hypothetical protein